MIFVNELIMKLMLLVSGFIGLDRIVKERLGSGRDDGIDDGSYGKGFGIYFLGRRLTTMAFRLVRLKLVLCLILEDFINLI